ncbi:MAG: DinB family protein [Longimicrobiales bacterium]
MSESELRRHLIDLLKSHNAHVGFEGAIRALSPDLRGARPEGHPHSPWQLLEHLRIAQWDIVEFSRHAEHVSPAWPEGYWPTGEAPPDEKAWEESVSAFRAELEAMCGLIASPSTELYAKIPWGDGQTILREALLLADHNAYHVGQLVALRRVLGDWPPQER